MSTTAQMWTVVRIEKKSRVLVNIEDLGAGLAEITLNQGETQFRVVIGGDHIREMVRDLTAIIERPEHPEIVPAAEPARHRLSDVLEKVMVAS